MSECLKKEIVLSVINHVVLRRRSVADVIFHSDRGVQYACNETLELLKKFKFIQSMSRKGNCYDNAVTERFFHILKKSMFSGGNTKQKLKPRRIFLTISNRLIIEKGGTPN